MTTRISNDKSTCFLLSEQVQKILQERGLSCIFNYDDYKLFKKQCARAFNKAMAIAEKFEELAEPGDSDFNDYIF